MKAVKDLKDVMDCRCLNTWTLGTSSCRVLTGYKLLMHPVPNRHLDQLRSTCNDREDARKQAECV